MTLRFRGRLAGSLALSRNWCGPGRRGLVTRWGRGGKRSRAQIRPGRPGALRRRDLAASGLPNECADAVICLDAIFFAADRIAALREVRRLLRSGGRYVFTAPEVRTPTEPFHVTDWTPLLEAAGLQLESKEEVPRFAEQLGRTYQLWLEHLDEIRAEVGDEVADGLEAEARSVGPMLKNRDPLLLVAHRP